MAEAHLFDGTNRFGGNLENAIAYFRLGNPFVHTAIISNSDNRWYKNTEAAPSDFTLCDAPREFTPGSPWAPPVRIPVGAFTPLAARAASRGVVGYVELGPVAAAAAPATDPNFSYKYLKYKQKYLQLKKLFD